MSKLEVDKIDPQSGTDLELGSSGDTVTIPTGVTLDASNATTTLPANVVTTTGTQTLTNKTIAAGSNTVTGLTNSNLSGSAGITNANLANSSITINDTAVSLGGSTSISTGGMYKNIIINGDMVIAQRSNSVSSINSDGYYTVDRFTTETNSSSVWTQSQASDAPSGQGFTYSLKMDCTTAQGSPASNDILLIGQSIEGNMLQPIKQGTANAQSTTLSFWHKHTKTGTNIVELLDADNNNAVSGSYTQSVSDTWEKATITFPANTSGTYDNDQNRSLRIRFIMSAGSNYTSGTLATTWQTSITDANRYAGQVNNADSTSNNFIITGVQYEVGTTASDFEFLPVDVNLQRCLRYYEKSYNQGIAPANGIAYGNTITTYQGTVYSTSAIRTLTYFKVPKRTSPSATFYNVSGLSGGTTPNRWEFWNGSSWVQTNSNTTVGEIEEYAMDVNVAHSGLTIGNSRLVGGGWSVDAEL